MDARFMYGMRQSIVLGFCSFSQKFLVILKQNFAQLSVSLNTFRPLCQMEFGCIQQQHSHQF